HATSDRTKSTETVEVARNKVIKSTTEDDRFKREKSLDSKKVKINSPKPSSTIVKSESFPTTDLPNSDKSSNP
ncbi:MAG: hypothetical protein ACK6BS_15960, partial [Pseudanabaena sp.]